MANKTDLESNSGVLLWNEITILIVSIVLLVASEN